MVDDYTVEYYRYDMLAKVLVNSTNTRRFMVALVDGKGLPQSPIFAMLPGSPIVGAAQNVDLSATRAPLRTMTVLDPSIGASCMYAGSGTWTIPSCNISLNPSKTSVP